jgi:hypothetical protein
MMCKIGRAAYVTEYYKVDTIIHGACNTYKGSPLFLLGT